MPDDAPCQPEDLSPTRNGPYDVRHSRRVYRNAWITVREDQVTHRPSGTEGLYGVVNLKDGVTVLALADDGHALLVKEFKYGAARESIELVSGGIDAGETPLETARRELAEEVGLRAARWTPLGVTEPFTTVMESRNYLYLAEGLSAVERSPDPFEEIEVLRVPLPEAVTMAMDGRIIHAASCLCLLKTALMRR